MKVMIMMTTVSYGKDSISTTGVTPFYFGEWERSAILLYFTTLKASQLLPPGEYHGV